MKPRQRDIPFPTPVDQYPAWFHEVELLMAKADYYPYLELDHWISEFDHGHTPQKAVDSFMNLIASLPE